MKFAKLLCIAEKFAEKKFHQCGKGGHNNILYAIFRYRTKIFSWRKFLRIHYLSSFCNTQSSPFQAKHAILNTKPFCFIACNIRKSGEIWGCAANDLYTTIIHLSFEIMILYLASPDFAVYSYNNSRLIQVL